MISTTGITTPNQALSPGNTPSSGSTSQGGQPSSSAGPLTSSLPNMTPSGLSKSVTSLGDTSISTPPTSSGGGGGSSSTSTSASAAKDAAGAAAKSFRVTLDDPCWKVLPAALKKYKIVDDWRQYAMFICFGSTGELAVGLVLRLGP